MTSGPRVPTPLEQRLTQLLLGQGALSQAQRAQAEAALASQGGSWTQALVSSGVAPNALVAACMALGSPPDLPLPPGVGLHPPRPEGSTPAMLTPNPPPKRPLPAQGRVGPYETGALLGRGGMATVYLGTHVETQQRVALKLMLSHLATDAQFLQRFVKEAQASEGLDHPNVVRVVSHGEDQGRYYMAFEYVDGGTLDHLLKNVGRLPWQVVVDAGLQLLSGLAHAHQAGIIHRDLKPANLLLSKSGVLKIADFGVAKQLGAATLTQTGAMVGTPMYLSPEMAAGEPVDHRSDLYTVGVILREMLCGTNPFFSENVASSIHRIASGTFPSLFEENPCVPPLLDQVVERLMLRDVSRRYASAREVMEALRPLQAQVEAENPMLLTGLAEDPAVVVKRLASAEARVFLTRAQDLLKKTHVERPAAAFNLFRALRQEPTLADAASLFDLLCKQDRFVFAPIQDPRILALEKTLADSGESPQALQQLALCYRSAGNLHRAAGAWRRYLRLRPEDGYARNQLLSLTQELPADLAPEAAPPAAAAAPLDLGPAPAAAAPARASTSRGLVLPPPDAAEDPEDAPPSRWTRLLVTGAAVLVLGVAVKVGGTWLRGATERQLRPTRPAAVKAVATPDPAAPTPTPAPPPPGIDGALSSRLDALVITCKSENWDACSADAEALFNEAPGSATGAKAQFLWGRSLLAQGSHIRAEELLARYLEENAGSADAMEALLRQGQAQRRGGDPTKSIETLTRLLTKMPDGPLAAEALLERGEASAQKDLKQDAVADLQQAVARLPGGSDPQARARQLLAELTAKP